MFASGYGAPAERGSSDPDERVGKRASDVEDNQVAFRDRVAALLGLGAVANQSGCAPYVGVVALIPIDEALAACDARDSRPASAEADVVLAIEEVRGVSGVEIHRFESLVSSQRRARPFPETSSVALAAQSILVSNCSGVPVVESDVATIKVDEEVCGIERGVISRLSG